MVQGSQRLRLDLELTGCHLIVPRAAMGGFQGEEKQISILDGRNVKEFGHLFYPPQCQGQNSTPRKSDFSRYVVGFQDSAFWKIPSEILVQSISTAHAENYHFTRCDGKCAYRICPSVN